MAGRHSQDPCLTSDPIAPSARGGGSEFAPIISGPKGRRRSCAVQAFLPWAKILAEAEFTSAEHFNFSRNPKKKDTTAVMSFFFGAGNEARTRFPASREWLTAIRRTPASPPIRSRLRRGVEAASSPPMQKTGHPKLDVLFHSGAGNEARTRYLHLGKVALYQMSYARGTRGILPEKHPLVKTLP